MAVVTRQASRLLVAAAAVAIVLAMATTAAAAVPVPAVTGTVTRASDSEPLSGIQVVAYRYDATGINWYAWDWTWTGTDGTYTLNDLPADTYRIEFFDESLIYRGQWYDHQSVPDAADPVVVSPPTTVSSVDASLDPYPGIAGRVTTTGSGAAVPAATVTAYEDMGGSWTATATAITDGDGFYSITGLGDGEFRVGVADSAPHAVGHSFYVSVADVADAADVTAIAGEAVIVDLTVPELVTSNAQPLYLGEASIEVAADTTSRGWPGADAAYSLDGGTPVYAPGGSATVDVTGPGSHSLEFWARSTMGTESVRQTAAFEITPVSPKVTQVVRVEAADRYGVSVATALAGHPGWVGVTDVIIASGEDRAAADPLAASGLSWAYNQAPILLVRSSAVSAEVKQAVASAAKVNGGITLRVVGGTASVPNARIAEIRSAVAAANGWSAAQAESLVRSDRILATGNRYDLAAAIARRMQAAHPGDFPRRALLANGADSSRFFDALALAPVAAHTGAPILLVKATSVPAPTLATLRSLSVSSAETFVAGGTSTVSSGVLASLGVPAGNRFAGPTRWATAVAVADNAIWRGWLSDRNAGVAAKLPDAVAAGATLGAAGAPMLLTAPTSLPSETATWLGLHRANLVTVYAFGGPSTISPATFTRIEAALK